MLVLFIRLCLKKFTRHLPTVTDFINTLAQSPALWQNAAGNVNYCTWAQVMLDSPSNYTVIHQDEDRSVIDRLRSCQPSNSQSVIPGGTQMPWLESTANGMKARVSKLLNHSWCWRTRSQELCRPSWELLLEHLRPLKSTLIVRKSSKFER